MTAVGITGLCDSPAIAGAVMETNAKMIGTGRANRLEIKRPVFIFVLLVFLLRRQLLSSAPLPSARQLLPMTETGAI
jgi:hypothetical protein